MFFLGGGRRRHSRLRAPLGEHSAHCYLQARAISTLVLLVQHVVRLKSAQQTLASKRSLVVEAAHAAGGTRLALAETRVPSGGHACETCLEVGDLIGLHVIDGHRLLVGEVRLFIIGASLHDSAVEHFSPSLSDEIYDRHGDAEKDCTDHEDVD